MDHCFAQPPANQARQFDSGYFLTCTDDDEFDLLYPEPIRGLSSSHWSPVDVCREAAQLLVSKPGARILDIGCGPGKFCLIGATNTQGHFTGIEQRASLVRVADSVMRDHEISRVVIMHSNIMAINFHLFDGFYLFNPFMENIFTIMRIDDQVPLSSLRYLRYVLYVQQQLSSKPIGTRVVTYCGDGTEIPKGYVCKQSTHADRLKLWVKVHEAPMESAASAAVKAGKRRLMMSRSLRSKRPPAPSRVGVLNTLNPRS